MNSSDLINKLLDLEEDLGVFDVYLGANPDDLAEIGELLISSSRTSNSVSIEPKKK